MKTLNIKQFCLRAVAIVMASATVFSCGKDYDGDINRLEQEINKVAKSVSDLQSQINGLTYIKSARVENGKLILVPSSGTEIVYSTPFKETEIDVRQEGNVTEIFVNGESKGKITVPDFKVEVRNGNEIFVNGKKIGGVEIPMEFEVRNGREIWLNGNKVGEVNIPIGGEVKNGKEIWVNGTKIGEINIPETEVTLNPRTNELLVNGNGTGIFIKDTKLTLDPSTNELLVNGERTGIIIKDPVLTLDQKTREILLNGKGTGIFIPAEGPTVTLIKDKGGNVIGVNVADGKESISINVGAIGHRLTSIAFVPKKHINGIAAIEFLSLAYDPQRFNVQSAVGQESTVRNGNPEVALNNGETYAYYRLNPRVGVTVNDFEFPSFDCIVSDHEVQVKSVYEYKASKNSPIEPVKGQEFKISNDGILAVKIRKTISDNIDAEGSRFNNAPQGDNTMYKEKFYMASLNVPIAEMNLTDTEKAANAKPSVNSEYVRIAESVVNPYIKNSKASNWASGYYAANPYNKFPNEIDREGRPLHYSDSLRLYKTGNDSLVDYRVTYNETFDLKKVVTVCERESHETISNYKDYGFALRFGVATGKYLQGTNQTDEQQFAKIDSPANGILSSKVYSVGNDGQSRTAIGREPIIRVALIDTINNKLVTLRYIKIRWVDVEIPPVPPINLDPYLFTQSTILACDTTERRFLTQPMNELIYHKVNGSMSKEDFHKYYTKLEIQDVFNNGSRIYNITKSTDVNTPADVMFYLLPDSLDNESYNLMWRMSPKAIGKVVNNGKDFNYEIKVVFKDTTATYPDVIMPFRMKVTIPTQTFYYNGTYWNGGTHDNNNPIFNINPINYKPVEDAADDNATADGIISNEITALKATSPYSQIKADLVNGYLYKPTSLKPTTLAQFIQQIRGCADVRFEFDKDAFGGYNHLRGWTVSNDGTELWKGWNAGTRDTTLDADRKVAYQQDNLAAWIDNAFGATAASNRRYLPWDYNETLMLGKDTCSATIQLAEKDYLNGTAAAKELIGKKIPVKLVVRYNEYNPVVVDKFEVYIINPLNINANFEGELSDNIYGGSFIGVDKAFQSTDWNSYTVAASALSSIKDEDQYAEELYHFYGVKGVVIDTDNVTTDLAWNGSSYDQKDNVTNGKLPTGASLKQFAKDKNTEVTINPIWLGYFNNDGTPVNKDYHLFVGTKVEYKWGIVEKDKVKIKVKKRLNP